MRYSLTFLASGGEGAWSSGIGTKHFFDWNAKSQCFRLQLCLRPAQAERSSWSKRTFHQQVCGEDQIYELLCWCVTGLVDVMDTSRDAAAFLNKERDIWKENGKKILSLGFCPFMEPRGLYTGQRHIILKNKPISS